jgi:hypothetical protein
MRNNSYQKLISHVTKREWVDATEIFRSIVEQKIALRLEDEKKLLTEPEDEVDEDCGEPGCPKDELKEDDAKTQKCKSCGKSFTPHNGEYARCKECFDKQTDAGERASYGRF